MKRSCNAKDAIENLLTISVEKAFPGLKYTPKVLIATNTKYGDYQTSDPMSLFPVIKDRFPLKNGKDVALLLIEHLPKSDLVSKATAAGAGYINFTLSTKYLQTSIIDIVQNGCRPPVCNKQKVIVDFSSPNIAKEMHVGHLRSTIIGEAICRILEFCGHDVDRINHLGDWGTQFGMLIAHMKDVYPDLLQNPPQINDLQKLYKESKIRFDDKNTPQFKERAHQEVVALQSGNPDNIAVWKLLCKISTKAFQEIYDRLHIQLTPKGESFYNDKIPHVIEILHKKGLIREDKGMKLISAPDYPDNIGVERVSGGRSGKQDLSLIVQKSDSGYGYDSTDLAAIYHRLIEEKADTVIYVVDAGQSSHFDLLFKVAEMAGWHQPGQNNLTHVAFGFVCGDDGKKFKTRSGDTVKLVDLLDEAVARARKIVQEKRPELDDAKLDEIAMKVGHSAVRYADLHQNRLTNYKFSYDKMLDLKGNTSVYIQYAYARAKSILKAATDPGLSEIVLTHKSELALARSMIKWDHMMEEVLRSWNLNEMCSYLYEVASAVSTMYRDCRVLGDPSEKSRLLLLKAATIVLETAMELLGLDIVEEI